MSPVTVGEGHIPWEDFRPWSSGNGFGPTHRELNEQAFAPASRQVGYCLCLHPMSNVIDFTGLSCKWCGQPLTDAATSEEARTLRTEAIKAAFPELVRQS